MTIEIKGVGKITAEPETLNLLALFANEASNRYEENSRSAFAKLAKSMNVEIHNALDDKHFFDK